MKNKKLSKSLDKFYQKKEDVQEILYGELGIPFNGVKRVDVPGRPGYVYVRLRGATSEMVQAYNSSVPSKYDYPVIVARKKNTYTILGKYQARYSNLGNTNATTGYAQLPNHGGQHSLNPRLGMGADPVWVYGQQIMNNLVYPSGSSMLLAVNPHFYEWNGQFKYPDTTVPDFTPYVPTVTGSARMVLLAVKGNTGALELHGGSLFSGSISNEADIAGYIPDLDRNQYLPLAAVKLTTGTTSLAWDDIYDVRDFYTVSKYFQGVGIQDSTTPKGTGTILNFGSNLSVTMVGNVATIDAAAGGGGGGGIGFVAWDEGVYLATGTILNFTGSNVVATASGTVVNVFVTGSSSAAVSPPITGSIVIWDEGVLKGSATVLDVVSSVADISISGTVARLFITGSASAPTESGTGTATYLRVGQPTPLSSTTGTYWTTPEPYATGTLLVFNQGHALIIGVDYTEQYPQSGTYQYTVVQETGTYHLSVYGVAGNVLETGGSAFTGTTASLVSITDTGGFYTGSTVESALQELGAGSGGGNVAITFETGTTNSGQDTNRTSAGTYTSHRGLITINYPMKLKSVLWDVSSAETYGVRVFRGWSTGTSAYIDFGTSGTAGVTADLTFSVDSPVLLMPGDYAIELRTPSAKTIADNTANSGEPSGYYDAFSVKETYYNTTKDNTFSPALRLIHYKGQESVV